MDDRDQAKENKEKPMKFSYSRNALLNVGIEAHEQFISNLKLKIPNQIYIAGGGVRGCLLLS